MKRNKIILLLVSLIMFPVNAYALTGTISAHCTPNDVHPGDTVTCTVSGTSDAIVTSISAPFTLSEGAEIVSFQTLNGWEGSDVNNNKIESYTSNDISGNFNIGEFKIKVNDNASAGNITLSFSNVEFGDDNSMVAVSGSSESFTVSIPAPEVEKGLKTLLCSAGGILSPQLTDSNRGYTIILNGPSTNAFEISATAKNSNDDIKFINADTNETLNPGNIIFKTSGGKDTMLIRVNVGSGDSLVEYTITVSKPVSEKGALATLVVGGKNVTLLSNKYDYQVTLDDVSSYQIQATVKDSSKFKIESTNVSRTLSGVNSYEITVRPIDNTSGYESAIYVIAVGTNSATPTKPPVSESPSRNPQTSEKGLVAMALTLIISLIASVYLYKRNINGYNN